jgi:hypothetical protein
MNEREKRAEFDARKWAKRMSGPLPDWHQWQGPTNDCGPFSAAIVTNALLDTHVADGPLVAQSMTGRTIPERIPNWATFPWGVVRALRRMAVRARWHVGASESKLVQNLDEGRTTIVIVGEPLRFEEGEYKGWAHYKVLYAWDPVEGWAFVDPAARRSKVYTYQDAETFRRQWTLMGRQLVEILGHTPTS